ncbi:TetR/AcrR family transcriptional regulator [Paraliobacillus ryukyuensis]|uniref:TetR/AcrR family transcriptional regulator n=1 Tax=Paraliobacillus ryukyuensis TaxID=200904 RepID=UPI0009A5621E|nr:TetR/AcrR family transcriptional regulator [Paraliobacillus ryukyuensis]
MAGLRETKKKNTRKAILEYAEKIFKEKGYSKVKTSEIAKGANIAEGTLFNYFSTKGELFVQAVFVDFNLQTYQIRLPQQVDENILVGEMVSIIDFYIKKMASVDKKLVREYFSIVFSTESSEALVARKSIFHMDEMIIQDSKQLLSQLKNEYEIIKEFDVDLAVEIIYGCVIKQFMNYIYSDNWEYFELIEEMKKEIQFVMHGNMLL